MRAFKAASTAMRDAVPRAAMHACKLASLCLSIAMLPGCGALPPPSAAMQGGAPFSASSDGITGALGGWTDKALTAIGIQKPEAPSTQDLPDVPDSVVPDWRVRLDVHASDSLNADEDGRPLALLVRIYRLKSPDAFLLAPYDSFGDPLREKAALNEDLVSVRELQLLPGQRHESLDKVARDARYIGVVALYRHPLAGHWRYAFSTPQAALSGLRLGALACALSVQVGRPVGHAAGRAGMAAAPCPDALATGTTP